MGRPEGSNADEWNLYISENKDATGMVAVGVAEAIEEAEARIWRQFVANCETIELQAERAGFATAHTKANAASFYEGQRFAAKTIRMSVVHPKYLGGSGSYKNENERLREKVRHLEHNLANIIRTG